MLRWVAGLLTGLMLSACSPAADAPSNDPLWRNFTQRFISSDGRVIDSANAGISHSEGQGYGLLLAAYHNDRANFDNIWQWTNTHLRVRSDSLFGWKWSPKEGRVVDTNNASDGDLLIAWGLLRGAKRWQQPAWRLAALQIVQTVRQNMVRESRYGKLLLPGQYGFSENGRITVNLSYWIFPAFAEFAELDPNPVWQELNTSGQALIKQARFGRWQLPPDWLELSGDQPQVQQEMDARFAYNALRIPLYLAWAGADPAILEPFAKFWASHPGVWANLLDNSVDPDPAPSGVRAVQSLLTAESWPTAEDQDYYPACLHLLARMAQAERHR